MAKRPIAPLADAQVRLRLLQPADLPQTLAWRNQDHIRKWFFFSDRLTPEQHAAWYTRYAERDDDFVFIIEEVTQQHRPVGQVALYNIDWATGRAEFGRLMIGEAEAAGRGLARAATALLVTTALGEWGLKEVYLEVYDHNAVARAIYARCGFQVASTHDHVVRMTRTA